MGTYSNIEEAYADHGRASEKVVERSKEEIDNECLRLVEQMLKENLARQNEEIVDVRHYCRASGLSIEYATRLLTENGYLVANFQISKKQQVQVVSDSDSIEGEESTLKA